MDISPFDYEYVEDAVDFGGVLPPGSQILIRKANDVVKVGWSDICFDGKPVAGQTPSIDTDSWCGCEVRIPNND